MTTFRSTPARTFERPTSYARAMHGNRWATAGPLIRYAGLMLALPVLVLAGAYKAHTYYGLSIGTLMRDPSAVANVPWYVGAISHLGVLQWTAAAAICAFTAALRFGVKGPRRPAWFMLSAAAMSAVLLFDDLFMLHEAVGPQIFSIGEIWFLSIDALLLLLFLIVFFAELRHSDWPLLAGAFGFFGMSVGIDLLDMPLSAELLTLGEDGSKFLGSTMWLAYFARTAYVDAKQGTARRR